MTSTAIFLILAQIVSILLMLLAVLFFFEGFLLKVPFVPVSRRVLRDISKALEVKDGSVVYDLGSGDGRVLLALAKENPKAKYIGLELAFIPFYLSKLRRIVSGSKISVRRKDFFKEDLSSATHIFVYLLPPVLNKLLPKLEKELKSGTKVVSATFRFSRKEPIRTIQIDSKGLVKTLYVYKF